MLKIIKPASELDSEIVVQTRKGSDILNSQLSEIPLWERADFPTYKSRYSEAIPRSEPTGIYNCHGLTFASRRTRIFEVSDIWKIIKEDKYFEIRAESVLPGDIIMYLAEDGDVEHSGIVVSEPDGTSHFPKVWSKWGKYCEILHYANYCPYNLSNIKYYRIKE